MRMRSNGTRCAGSDPPAATLMLLTLLFLPIHFASRPARPPARIPPSGFLGLIILGVPFCIVSTTAPLLQNWLSKTPTALGSDPYFLYGISNAGSLLALLEAVADRTAMGREATEFVLWFAGYCSGLVLLLLGGATVVWKHVSPDLFGDRVYKLEPARDLPALPPTWSQRLFWLAAAFVPSGLMLAVTNHMLLNLASVPFLWVMPLAIYLVSFLSRSRDAFGFRRDFIRHGSACFVGSFPLVAVSQPVAGRSLKWVLGSRLLVLFAGALLCHTTLASRRPPAGSTDGILFLGCAGWRGVFVAVVYAIPVFQYGHRVSPARRT